LLSRIDGWADHTYEADAPVIAAAAQTETPAGVIAALRFPEQPELSSLTEAPLGLVLDRVADPGNAGTILRTAAAAGVGYVITTADTVDLFSPKVVRAGMGAHFRLPLHVNLTWDELDAELSDVDLIIAELEGESVFDFTWPECAALVVGSEAHGISDEAKARASHSVRIPMRGGVESLNASVAASILMYSAVGHSIEGS
jgi:TrmH family RNA methyltransferase